MNRLVAGCAVGLLATALQAVPASADEGRIRGASVPGSVENHYIVVLKDGQSPTPVAGRIAELGGTIVHTYTAALRGFAVELGRESALILSARADVAYVQQDHLVTRTGTQADPPSWGLDRIDQQSLPLSGAYVYPNTAAAVRVYVVDDGLRTTHTDFGGRATNGADLVDDGAAVTCAEHGTNVAGIIGGSEHGVAKGVAIVGVRVFPCAEAAEVSDVVAGIDWVTDNAVLPAVLNMSVSSTPDETIDAAIEAAVASGITVVVGAGNHNTNACLKSPARVPEVITVGATDEGDSRAEFSNYGSCIDLFAPGVDIVTTSAATNAATETVSGTSFAAPHVAGAAAMILQDSPLLTPAQVTTTLIDRAVTGKLASLGAASPNRLLQNAVTVAPVRVDSSIDGDAEDEIIHFSHAWTVHAWRNVHGLDSFPYTGPEREIGYGFDPARTRFADIDGDGKDEIIHIDNAWTVRAFRNVHGLDSFPYTADSMIIGVGFEPGRTRFADLDGDGRDEITHVDTMGTVRAFPNINGLDSRPYSAPAREIGYGFVPDRLRFADIDGDGKDEIISIDVMGKVWAFRNVFGLTRFPFPQDPLLIGHGWTPARTFFGDINGDGRAEIIHVLTNGMVNAFRNVHAMSSFPYTAAEVTIGYGFDPARTMFSS